MSKSSTALIMVGPSGVGPFHSDEWRVGLTLQLVEGGSNGPYWLTTPGESILGVTRPDFLLIDSLEASAIAESLSILLLAITASEEDQTILLQLGVLTKTERGIGIPPKWIFPHAKLKTQLHNLTQRYRLGIVILDEFTLLTEDVTTELSSIGLSIQAFLPSTSVKWMN